MTLLELSGRPRRDRVGDLGRGATGECDQLTVGVAAYEGDAVAERRKPVEHLDGLRSGGVVPRHDEPPCRGDGRLREHRVENGQHAVDVGEYGDGVVHIAIVATRRVVRQALPLPAEPAR